MTTQEAEEKLQSRCYMWFNKAYPEYRRCMFHVPNEGKRTVIRGMQLKAMGLVPGIPDLCLCLQGKVWFIEMKTEKGYLSESQKITIPILKKNGNPVFTCRSFEQFQSIIYGILEGLERIQANDRAVTGQEKSNSDSNRVS